MKKYLLAMLIGAQVLPANGEVVVVVNKSNPVNSISRTQLKNMILGSQRKWPGGAAVSVITAAPGDPDRKAALTEFVGMSEQQFATAMIQANFKGEDRVPPKTLPSSKIIVQVVGLTPGAVGIVNAADVTPGVKRVSIGE